MRTKIKRLYWEDPLDLARSTFYVLRKTFAKFGLRADNEKFNTQNEESISMHLITCIILLMYLSVLHVQ
jgi:hypothetical protein